MAQNVIGMMFLMAMTEPKFEDKSFYKEPVPLTNALIYPLTSVKVITKLPLNIGGDDQSAGEHSEGIPEEEDAGSQEANDESREAGSQEEDDDGDGDEASDEDEESQEEAQKEDDYPSAEAQNENKEGIDAMSF